MGREVRRVPADWDHWKYSEQPLLDGYNKALARWTEHNDKWNQGLELNYTTKQWETIADKYKNISYSEYDGNRPDPTDYMPDWNESERTHYQAYENTTEGTPISPVLANEDELNEDELIDWLVSTKFQLLVANQAIVSSGRQLLSEIAAA